MCCYSLRENEVKEKVCRDFRHLCYPSTLECLEREGRTKFQSFPVSLGS